MRIKKDTKKVVVALIKNDQDKFLLLKLKGYFDHKDEWCPVAGHVKSGESIEEAIVREVYEELKVVATPKKLISEWNQDIPGEKAYWWKVEIKGDVKINTNEIEEIAWFSKDEIKNLKLWPATEKFFKQFIWR